MFNLFKSTDDQLKDLGFIKKDASRFGVTYERSEPGFEFTHVVDIYRKSSGNWILHSYDDHYMDPEEYYSPAVALTYDELRLFTKKMKEMGACYNG